ncbi:IclR family transcriptional regulator [Anaeromicrobium sediminis]|uniref:Glycerol operon regulatory protein n=1 Tax=Anaeromicrobium sediminis TaxID=1478221 RepID=A0A267MM24_9FIRM|nr:IclR family transcriptional regulator [Anaeromicrobium sediminis]PAB59810.1 hypothetical protein CCE28_07590 [Anaeromicrobium sediminis]
MISSKSSNPRVIQSIQRALDIIDCFTKSDTELSLNEISKGLGLNKSTAHGIINTLHINGYIEQNSESGKYMLGKKFMMKGLLVSDSIAVRLKDIGIQYLKILTEKYSSTTHLFSYKNKVLSFVEKITPSNAYYIVSSVIGKEMPLHATASGKIVLAHMTESELENYLQGESLTKFTEKTLVDIDRLKEELERIISTEYCIEDEEVESGVFSISAPIYDNHKVFIGTISLTAPVGRVKDMTQEIVMDMKNSSKKITEELFNL